MELERVGPNRTRKATQTQYKSRAQQQATCDTDKFRGLLCFLTLTDPPFRPKLIFESVDIVPLNKNPWYEFDHQSQHPPKVYRIGNDQDPVFPPYPVHLISSKHPWACDLGLCDENVFPRVRRTILSVKPKVCVCVCICIYI